MTIESHADLRAYFRDRVASALSRMGAEPCAETEFYVVDLLARFAIVPSGFLQTPLAHRLAEALESPDTTERFRRFRDMGDCALYLGGFFSDHLERRGINPKYVTTMGGRAYRSARDLAPHTGVPEGKSFVVYDRLAERFEQYMRVLDAVRESTEMRTPQDIVRLYDRYRRTRSPILAERLREEGVYPQASSKTTIH